MVLKVEITKSGAVRRRIVERAKAHYVVFSPAAIRKLKRSDKQYLVWDGWPDGRRRDDVARGLCVLVSPRGTKSYRAVYYKKVPKEGSAKPQLKSEYVHIGRVGELDLEDETELQSLNGAARQDRRLELEIEQARRRCKEIRRIAKKGLDPTADDPKKSDTFENAFKYFIKVEQIDARQNKSASKTQSFVIERCAEWRYMPVATITANQIDTLVRKIGSGDKDNGIEGRRAAAVRIFSHLRDFFGWCERPGGPLKASPMRGMRPPYALLARDRVYSDDELKTIWEAAGKLDPAEERYVKLILMLALRREELAQAKWSEFDNPDDPKMFVVPFARTKGKVTRKRKTTYPVPLPPLAQRLIKGLRRDGENLFPRIDQQRLKAKIVSLGAPTDFTLHVARHTVSTWLENKGKSLWERGLVLNHAASGVTAGYSHGYPTETKRTLLAEWADHIEQLVQPGENVSVLR